MTAHTTSSSTRWITLAVALMFTGLTPLATSGQAEDMQQYLNETREMVRGGRFEEALERMLWFHHNALEHQPSMAGVRLSFALRDWKNLGDVYPPARAALVETRDATLRLLLENPGNRAAFQDLNGLNRTLGEESRTLDVFVQLAAEHPEEARSHWTTPDRPGTATRLALEAKRLDLLRAHGIDMIQEFERVTQQYESRTRATQRAPRFAEIMKEADDRYLVEQTLLLIEIALALGEEANARTIQQRALALLPDPRVRSAIP